MPTGKLEKKTSGRGLASHGARDRVKIWVLDKITTSIIVIFAKDRSIE